jgi:hypothetical protein
MAILNALICDPQKSTPEFISPIQQYFTFMTTCAVVYSMTYFCIIETDFIDSRELLE